MEFDFEKDLSIDKYSLDKECLSHASLYFRYADAHVQAKKEVSRCTDALTLAKADANINIRKIMTDNNVKFTESIIASEVERDKNVQLAREELRKAETVCSRLGVAVASMEARKSELDNLVKLYLAGYYATPMSDSSQPVDVTAEIENDIRRRLNGKKESWFKENLRGFI